MRFHVCCRRDWALTLRSAGEGGEAKGATQLSMQGAKNGFATAARGRNTQEHRHLQPKEFSPARRQPDRVKTPLPEPQGSSLSIMLQGKTEPHNHQGNLV